MPDPEPMTRVIRSLRSGQITIPAPFRRALGIEDDTLLQLTLEDGELRVRPVALKGTEGTSPLKEIYEHFAPVREEILARGIGEEELNSDIDAALDAVRKRRS